MNSQVRIAHVAVRAACHERIGEPEPGIWTTIPANSAAERLRSPARLLDLEEEVAHRNVHGCEPRELMKRSCCAGIDERNGARSGEQPCEKSSPCSEERPAPALPMLLVVRLLRHHAECAGERLVATEAVVCRRDVVAGPDSRRCGGRLTAIRGIDIRGSLKRMTNGRRGATPPVQSLMKHQYSWHDSMS